MAWLNYHHLLYFWTVARAGTIAAASKELHLSQPTISTQLKTLEESLGQKLFQRQGRKLVLTDKDDGPADHVAEKDLIDLRRLQRGADQRLGIFVVADDVDPLAG